MMKEVIMMGNYNNEEEEEEESINLDVNIVMKEEFKDKIDWLSINYDEEIAGFITGEIMEDSIILEDLIIPEQEVGSAHVDMTGKQLVKLRKEYKDKCKKILGEWHSHNTMGCSWSSTDEEDFIKPFAKPRKITLFIVSSMGKHQLRIEIRKPFFMSLDNLPYSVEGKNNDKLKKFLEKEIKKKVMKSQVETQFSNSSFDGLGYNNFGHYPHFAKYNQSKKNARGRLSGMWKFYNNNNKLEISGLSEGDVQSLEKAFKDLNASVKNSIFSGEYDVKIIFKNRIEAMQEMKEIRAFLVPLLIAKEEELNAMEGESY